MVQINPFQIKTPEKLPPDEAASLFVDVFTDYQKIKAQGHTFIIGPRGIGKSMIFRYLEPDCQCISTNAKINQLDFLGLYIPLKNASFTTITELLRLERNAAYILNEHIMVTFVLQKVFSSLSNENLYEENDEWNISAQQYYYDEYLPRLPAGHYQDCLNEKIYDIFKIIAKQMDTFYSQAMQYTKRLAFTKDIYPYDGPLFDYLDFVVPLISALSSIKCFPQKTMYFLIDDAHSLTSLQTKILNYWVSTRTSGEISLKISSQYNYKHYYTITGATIDTPHDYSEVDMTFVYTGSAKPKYKKRITEIITKRLLNIGIDKTVDEFFPCDKEQEKKINAIAESYRKRFDEGMGRGNRRGDDALRYSRPDYIKSLMGTAKSGSTYSYSGFDQLVHLSSGIVRAFLESAYKMYAEEMSRLGEDCQSILSISDSVQNEVVREDANQFLFDLQRYSKGVDGNPENQVDTYPKEDIDKLSNLIQALGGLFKQILLSERSERRVFSIAISDVPSLEVERILNLGIQLGYFHSSTIGRKDGKSGGRTKLYILNRRLSPIWTLDPTAFAGYLFVQNALLESAMVEPFRLLRRLGKDMPNEEMYQLTLFDDFEGKPFYVEEGV